MTVPQLSPEATTVERFERDVRAWLEEHAADLRGYRVEPWSSVSHQVARMRPFHRMLFDAGFTSMGWPVEIGGSGGTPLLRGVLYDEVLSAGYELPKGFEFLEIIVPTLMHFASHLAARHLPGLINGDELMCQGFSEPDFGSDLASIVTRARETEDGFRISGQKTWIGNGHIADWCLLLARTGDRASRHRGLTMFWLDMASPGITTRPIELAAGTDELAEVFLDDVVVPRDHLVGEVNGGWNVAMHLLQFERGNWAWQRQAYLDARLRERARDIEPKTPEAAFAVGQAFLDLLALRALAHRSLHETAAGRQVGEDSSIAKLVLSMAEKSVVDAERALDPDRALVDDGLGPGGGAWFHSRSASIFGGAAEVQRDVVADRLLHLPRAPR